MPSAAAHTTFEGCFIPGMDLVNHQRGDERMLSSRDGNITLRHTISTARYVYVHSMIGGRAAIVVVFRLLLHDP